jgi:methanogenic corrinoid protein MtbC1
MMDILMEISELLQKGRAKLINDTIQKALNQGLDAKKILEEGLMHGMKISGGKFSRNEIFVPEMLISARAMNVGLEVLKPYFREKEVSKKGTIVFGTVKGDLHNIGKNLVKIMMEGKGLEVIDIGIDVPREKFIEKAKEAGAQIVALSALLTITIKEMAEVVKAFEKAGIRDKYKIMIGGALVTDKYREEIGADLYAPNATEAAEVALAACTK